MTFAGVYFPVLLAFYPAPQAATLRELTASPYAQHVLDTALGFVLDSRAPADVLLFGGETWETCQARLQRDIPGLSLAAAGRVDLLCASLPRVYGRFLRLLTLSSASRDAMENTLRFAVGHAEPATVGAPRGEWSEAQNAFLNAALGLERSPPAIMPPDEAPAATEEHDGVKREPEALLNSATRLLSAGEPAVTSLPKRRHSESAASADGGAAKRVKPDDGLVAGACTGAPHSPTTTFVLWADEILALLDRDGGHGGILQIKDQVVAARPRYAHLSTDSKERRDAISDAADSVAVYTTSDADGPSGTEAQREKLKARFWSAGGEWWYELVMQRHAPAEDAPGMKINLQERSTGHHAVEEAWWIVDIKSADEDLLPAMEEMCDDFGSKMFLFL
jgi:hypothetical protein